eukprot:1018346_1
MAQQTRQTLSGTCKRFNVEKGYGFIEMDDGSEDVFVHYSDINSGGFQSLTTGESLEFSVVEDDGRRKAINMEDMLQVPKRSYMEEQIQDVDNLQEERNQEDTQDTLDGQHTEGEEDIEGVAEEIVEDMEGAHTGEAHTGEVHTGEAHTGEVHTGEAHT